MRCPPIQCQHRNIPRESELLYNVQRRFVDLDGNGQCLAMDVWLERLASAPDSVSRNFNVNHYRFDGKKWQQLVAPYPTYYPYALKAAEGQVFYIQAPIDQDVGDSIVLGNAEPMVWHAAAPNRRGLFAADGFTLTPYEGDTKPLLRALATLLDQRLQSSQRTREELSIVDPSGRSAIEKQRIAGLLKRAGAASAP